MPPTALIDTNILVYAYDARDSERQRRAERILAGLQLAAAGYLSVKTLSEFFVVVRRIPTPLTTSQALDELQKLALSWPILNLTPFIVLEAARGVRDYSFSYWDAQIWATAKNYHINAVFTEDMAVGSVVEGVSIINPLLDTFIFDNWLST